MSKKLKQVLFVISICVFTSTVTVKIYEPVSTRNIVINSLKRATAEIGRFVILVYDPYVYKRKIASLSPHSDFKYDGNNKIREDFLKQVESNDYLKSHLKIIEYTNKDIVKSYFEFDYQPVDESKLKILREKYGLEDVVKQGKTEFQKQIILRNWIRQRWSIGEPKDVSYNFNALDILDRAQKGEKFFCSEYSTTYVQVLAVVGMTARYVGLLKGHVVVEVWSNEFNKWIVMDPSYNIHYELSRIPLNALELHNAWVVNNNWKNVKVMKGDFQPVTEDIIDNHQFKLIDYYENFYVRMRNDWFSNIYPHWYPKANSIMNGIEWSDKYTKNDIRVARETNRVEDLYWQLNHVYMKIIDYNISNDTATLKLYLDTTTPNFDKFLIKFDNNIEYSSQSVFDWELHKGVNTLETTSVNKFGIEGIFTRISIKYD